mmetsp:Transcript_30020/g.50476  ORF Transcript_30020/g.50476 Transcript_30020/m.50476 type:complete len:181 (-) Transcript_30020:288-830(-)
MKTIGIFGHQHALVVLADGARSTGISILSGVPDQPFGDRETLLGARNRVCNLAAQHPECDLLVAIEGGVRWDDDAQLECFAWVVIKSGPEGAESKARSASFVLPKEVADLVRDGMELGDADDEFFKRVNSGQGSGTVGRLTHGLIDRSQYYSHAVTLALVPLMNARFYPGHLDLMPDKST